MLTWVLILALAGVVLYGARATHVLASLPSGSDRRQPMPADSIIPTPMAIMTNAITIKAPPERVWPWLVQMGGGRGGWYSYDFIDNGGHPSATRIRPELQDTAPGDIMPAIPGSDDAFVVAAVQPPHDLILTVPLDGHRKRVSWEYFLRPINGGITRLIARGRVAPEWLTTPQGPVAPGKPIFIEKVYSILARLPRALLLAVARFGHHVMVSRQLYGIKVRAEGAGP